MEQSEKSRLSQDTLRRFAEFAGVKFSEARLERIVPRVERYLEDVNTLEEVDVSEAEPATIFSMKQEWNEAGVER